MELSWKLKAKKDGVVISGLLPAPRASNAGNRERVHLNTWLQGWCRREGFRYLDNWSTFCGRWTEALRSLGLPDSDSPVSRFTGLRLSGLWVYRTQALRSLGLLD